MFQRIRESGLPDLSSDRYSNVLVYIGLNGDICGDLFDLRVQIKRVCAARVVQRGILPQSLLLSEYLNVLRCHQRHYLCHLMHLMR